MPGPGNLVASTPDTLYLDGEWRWDEAYYYKVAAVDIHGNESGYVLLRPEDVTGSETQRAPEATYLSQNFPNPFNPMTKIEFGLSAPAHVSLRIYDAAGRLVRVLANGARQAGRYSEVWDGRDAPHQTQSLLHIVTLCAKVIAYGADGQKTFLDRSHRA